MIIKASHHPIVYPFFKLYAVLRIRRHFYATHVMDSIKLNDTAILVLSNHTSWWDGFWIMYLNVFFFKRKFHFMMLEEQLLKYKFFRKTGGFSIRKKSRTAVETINYTAQLLDTSENMVLIFPQGKIESMHVSSIAFENGLEHILQKTSKPVQLVFSVNLIDYFSNQKPSLYMYLQTYEGKNATLHIQQAYNNFYQLCLLRQQQLNNTP